MGCFCCEKQCLFKKHESSPLPIYFRMFFSCILRPHRSLTWINLHLILHFSPSGVYWMSCELRVPLHPPLCWRVSMLGSAMEARAFVFASSKLGFLVVVVFWGVKEAASDKCGCRDDFWGDGQLKNSRFSVVPVEGRKVNFWQCGSGEEDQNWNMAMGLIFKLSVEPRLTEKEKKVSALWILFSRSWTSGKGRINLSSPPASCGRPQNGRNVLKCNQLPTSEVKC